MPITNHTCKCIRQFFESPAFKLAFWYMQVCLHGDHKLTNKKKNGPTLSAYLLLMLSSKAWALGFEKSSGTIWMRSDIVVLSARVRWIYPLYKNFCAVNVRQTRMNIAWRVAWKAQNGIINYYLVDPMRRIDVPCLRDCCSSNIMAIWKHWKGLLLFTGKTIDVRRMDRQSVGPCSSGALGIFLANLSPTRLLHKT